jgi:hypothetical protein
MTTDEYFQYLVELGAEDCTSSEDSGGFAIIGTPPPSAETVEPERKMRVWTSNDGKTIEAQFLWYANGTVALKKPDGTTVKVPIDRFGEADQTFIHQGAKE